MENRKKRLPIGVENFKKLRMGDFYYVDKTGLVRELLAHPAEVTLFTRPRRFGKSLNMNMLQAFFCPEEDKSYFKNLEISKETALCEKYMGKFPVILVSLKGVNAGTYENARDMAVQLINGLARNFVWKSRELRREIA